MGILLNFGFDYIQDTQSHRLFLGRPRLLVQQTGSSIRFSKCKSLTFLAFMSFVTMTSLRKMIATAIFRSRLDHKARLQTAAGK